MDASLPSLATVESRAAELDLRALYLEHGGFLWRSLQRLGVRDSDLEDVLQDVLLVIHRYWLGSRAARLRGYVGIGFGSAQFDGEVRVGVRDCGETPGAAQTDCVKQGGPGVSRTLSAYQRFGKLFVPARIGAAWTVSENHALTFGLSANIAFPNRGVVLEPSIGYAAGF